MANRYDKPLIQTRRADGALVYQTARPSAVNPTVRDITIAANELDRFDIIAQNVYGSPRDWWRIAAINGKVNGSLHVKPGNNLIIPSK